MAKCKNWKYDYNSGFYKSWSSMKSRCNNKNHVDYPRWGGRGIAYDSKWETFEVFRRDMESTYRIGLTLDRIDNSKGYSKENCRWATRKEQNNNRRDNISLTYRNQTKNLSQWAKDLGFRNITTLHHRIFVHKWSIEKALTMPVRGWNKI